MGCSSSTEVDVGQLPEEDLENLAKQQPHQVDLSDIQAQAMARGGVNISSARSEDLTARTLVAEAQEELERRKATNKQGGPGPPIPR
mmetsp:Transcript_32062/g.38840  ORF Transcript_32062/g.38840 Transcript_32062/m.38840 type:complete len:87 (-) Transcript_32062:256-516(-)|eukprot:CAMPEP_0197856196 /NCGR_PEP_ID=MMETSP1438-20131217/28078_1 /TAXON_ID=1461541 /ORGANISM="Pterosperma sp., Strain CCMP1384" /LENGTH=86 /DNA_ID=CAMNT_0043471571 /DNA_START=371 /DNA_END=631 /DNA_ORIENTATION=+